MHSVLAPEFARELKDYGRIYMHRFRPPFAIQAQPFDWYPGIADAAAMKHMMDNNLDRRVAQHPYELVTYGGNGTVFPNWAQYLLTRRLLATMTNRQTLHMYSGHPLGLVPAPVHAPRVVLTNGMMVPNYSTPDDYLVMAALGATSYGQMTAGSWMYIGSQGIVHGTYLTLLGAAQRALGLEPGQSLNGKVFVTSGLGGMSGAQAKAALIAGAIGVVAEINPVQAAKMQQLGWVQELTSDLDEVGRKIREHQTSGEPLSLGYVGNVVNLWEYLDSHNIRVDIGSDQTSLHLPYDGGYYPAGMTMGEAQALMADPTRRDEYISKVHESLRRQVDVINRMASKGTYFFDYGNGFLRMSQIAGADVTEGEKFKYPSYVEHVMGPQYFDYGFGPFRWVCTSGLASDLEETDKIAAEVMQKLYDKAPPETKVQYGINLKWIKDAQKNRLVVGSQARILYADMEGRQLIAQAFNKAIRSGRIKAPIVLGRDHHDVSGTDSPFRETANIYDGSNRTADMSVHNAIGLGYQGATWLSLHNGGGVGWGQVMNGGFGLVLDGSRDAARRIRFLFPWDVGNGLARRGWAGNPAAQFAVTAAQERYPGFNLTQAHASDPGLVDAALAEAGLRDRTSVSVAVPDLPEDKKGRGGGSQGGPAGSGPASAPAAPASGAPLLHQHRLARKELPLQNVQLLTCLALQLFQLNATLLLRALRMAVDLSLLDIVLLRSVLELAYLSDEPLHLERRSLKFDF